MTNLHIPIEDRTVYFAHPIDSNGREMDFDEASDWNNFFDEFMWTMYSPLGAFKWSGSVPHASVLKDINHHALMAMNFMIALDPWKSVGVAREIQMRTAWKPTSEILVTSTEGSVPKTPYLMDRPIRTFATPTQLQNHLSLRCSEEQTRPKPPQPPDPSTLD
jgi:hypothetical protein